MKALTAPGALHWNPFLGICLVLIAALLVVVRFIPSWLTALLPAVIALRVLAKRRGGARTSGLVRFALMLGILVGVVVEFGNIFGRDAGSALLAAMLTLKLLETDSRRDARVVVAGACFLVMGGFLFEQGIVQTVGAFVFAIVALAALHDLVPGPPPKHDALRSWRPYTDAGWRWGAKLATFAVPFAIACFVFFPRFSAPLWGTPQDGLRSRTGMSETMAPGQNEGQVYLDDTPQFRVTFDGGVPPPAERYWRVFVFWRFDGITWGNRQLLDGFPDGPVLQNAGNPSAYEIVLEPTDERWLPVLDAPVEIPPGAKLSADFQVTNVARITSVERYRATSFTTYRMQPELPRLQYVAATDPGRGRNARTRTLGATLREETGGNPIAIADRVLAMFNREFTYAFDPPMGGENPVDLFLFDSKRGYCEHFASAFVTVMRAAGVPARVVAGYQGGYYNPIGNYLLVRRSDAHAWAEVWLPGSGWVRYDPTASVAPERIQDGRTRSGELGLSYGGWFAELRQRWDVVGHWWTRAIVEFNALRQRDFIDRTGLQRLGAMALVVLLVGSALLALVLAGTLGFRPRRVERDPVLFAWRALCRGIQRSGLPRGLNEGPVDFAARAADAFPAHAEAIRAVSRDFVALRYAANEADSAAAERFSAAARRLRSALRRQRVRRNDAAGRPHDTQSRKAQ